MRALSLALLLSATSALAEPPKVMTDIVPVQSLVDMVMGDIGQAGALMPPGASPHSFALRPADATALANADVVIWTGPGLSLWLTEPLATLAPDAATLVLLDTSGWQRLDVRNEPSFTAPPNPDIPTVTDPHAWMDPDIAVVWLGHIATTLASADPDNAAIYSANAAAAATDLRDLGAEIVTRLAPLADRPFVLPHDGYRYFENRFGLHPVGAITLSGATDPGPADLAELRDLVKAGGIDCILTDAETSQKWVDLLGEGMAEIKTARIDGLGGSFPPGADNYPTMLRQMADALVGCLS